MNLPSADIASLRRQLGEEIDRALETSEHLGVTLVSCHLQMARDMLGEPVARAIGPLADSAGRDLS
jgi:hypothetical protein